MSKHIGEQLKNAREKKKWTQGDLAKKLDISSRQVQKYEDGVFPKYKGDKIKEIDALLGTNFYVQIYEQGVQQVEEIKKPAPQGEEGLKEDLIAALKMNNALLEARVKELEARQAAPPLPGTDIESRLQKIHENQRQMFALLVSYQQHWLKIQLHSPKKFAEALGSIEQNALENRDQLLQQSTSFFEGTDGNSKS